ncbi:hypothetical protein ABW19_dt0205617 [Dactylella cylindrospora]|nr:hypothetical protein ABW19_dt0205617 [Dactylella cylindrospora]
MGGGGKAGPNNYLGPWGNFGLARQRGITEYYLASNRQNPGANIIKSAIFNGWRRFRGQVLYVIPPFIAGYYLLEWADKKNHFYNSKAGQHLLAEEGGSD